MENHVHLYPEGTFYSKENLLDDCGQMDERTSSTKTNKVYKGKNIAKSNKRERIVNDHNHPHPESPRYRVNLIM